VEALTDPVNGLPLEQHRRRDLLPGECLGLVLLKAPDSAAVLQLRYDRADYEAEDRAETYEALGQRTGEGQPLATPEGLDTGWSGSAVARGARTPPPRTGGRPSADR
jgi:hypothetical protein